MNEEENTGSFLDYLGNGVGKAWNFFTTPIGTGDNATTPLQMFAPAVLGGIGLINQNKYNKAVLANAQQAVENQWKLGQYNAQQQGIAFGNNLLSRNMGMSAFNPEAGKELAQNSLASFDQLAQAGQRIGLNPNDYSIQRNRLQTYA